MINEKGIHNYLALVAKRPRFIQRGVLYTTKDINFLLEMTEKYGKTAVGRLYEPLSDVNGSFWAKIVCFVCNKTHKNKLSRTKFEAILDAKGKFHCPSCVAEQNATAAIARKKSGELHKKNQEIADQDAIQTYIDQYLDPDKSWVSEVKHYDRFRSVASWPSTSEAVLQHIKEMDYIDFLETPYWKAVAQKVRYKAKFRCQLCNAMQGVYVHHRTYSIHGNEINKLNDLIALCEKCHQTFHVESEVHND